MEDDTCTVAQFLASDLTCDPQFPGCLPVEILDQINGTCAMLDGLPHGAITVEQLARFEVSIQTIRDAVEQLIGLGRELGAAG